MKRSSILLVVGLVLLSATATVRHAQQAPNTSKPSLREVLESQRYQDKPTEQSIANLIDAARAANSSRESIAALLEDPAVQFKFGAKAKYQTAAGDFEAEMTPESGKVKVPTSPIHQYSVWGEDRTVGIGTEWNIAGAGASFKVFSGLEGKYKSNADAMAAVASPLLAQVKSVYDWYTARDNEVRQAGHRLEDHAGGQARTDFEERAAKTQRTVAQELKTYLSAQPQHSLSLRSGITFEDRAYEVTSGASVGLDFSRPDDPLFSRTETEVVLKQGFGFGPGHVDATVSISLTDRPSPDAEVTALRKELAALIRAGKDTEVALLIAEDIASITLTESERAFALKLIREGNFAAHLALEQLVAQRNPGGILLHFNPAFTGASVPLKTFTAMIRRAAELARQGVADFAVQPSRRLGGLQRVVVDSSLLSKPDLGLTSVTGYVARRDGTLELIGQVEPGGTPIPRDYLVVALAAIWRDGLAPYVSLDPDPDNMAGDQEVRVGGLPPGMEHSGFVEAMLEADYLMKRLDMGVLKLELPGYTPTSQLISDAVSPPAAMTSRMWLVPASSAVGDIYDFSDDAGDAVLFRTGVAVQSETMRRAGNMFIGTGESNPIVEAAAASLTANYPEIARQPGCGAFARLHGVFEVAKLAALWRARGVTNEALRQIAGFTPVVVHHRDHYTGIGPVSLRGGNYQLSGGANTRVNLRAAGRHTLPALGNFLAKDTPQPIWLPDNLQFTGGKSALVSAELSLNSAVQKIMSGHYREALARADAALEADPYLANARGVRGLALYALGDSKAALPEIEAVVDLAPEVLALKALVEASLSRNEAALATCRSLETIAGNDAGLLALCAEIRLRCQDFEGADQLAGRSLALSPLEHDATLVRDTLAALYRGTPAQAETWLARLRAIPPAALISQGQGQTALARGDVIAAAQDYRRAYQALLEADPKIAGLRQTSAYLLAMALHMASLVHAKAGDEELAEQSSRECWALVEQLTRDHPDWMSVDLLACECGAGRWTVSELTERLRKSRGKPNQGDPIAEEMARNLGSTSLDRAIALSILMSLNKYKNLTKESVEAFLAVVSEILAGHPEHKAFELIFRSGMFERNRLEELGTDLALQKFTEVFPDEFPQDVASAGWLCHLMQLPMMMMTRRVDDGDFETLKRFIPRMQGKFLRAARVQGLPEASRRQVAVYYAGTIGMMIPLFQSGLEADPGFKRLKAQAQSGRIEAAATRVALNEILRDRIKLLEAQTTPFVAAYIAAVLSPRSFERVLCEDAFEAIGQIPETERESAVAALTAWRDQLRQPGGEAYVDGLIAASRLATTDIEQSAIMLMVDQAVAQVNANAARPGSSMQDKQGAADMESARRRIKTQFRDLSANARDWATWRGAVKAAAIAPEAETPAWRQKLASDWPFFLAIVGAALMSCVTVGYLVWVRQQTARKKQRDENAADNPARPS